MCGTYFHDLSRSQVTAWIYSSERWKKFWRSVKIIRLQVYEKVLGTISRFMSPKMKLFVAKFRRILEVFALRGLWRNFWAHFHDLCVQNWSCFLRSSDAFWRFSPCEVYKKNSWRIITIFASKNEAVCCEVQTDFGSFLRASFIKKLCAHFLDFCVQKWSCLLLCSDGFGNCRFARFTKKVMGAFSRLMRPKTKLFLRSSDAFRKFSLCEVYKKKFMAHYLEFLRPKMKLFAVEFRRVLEVFALQNLWRKFLAHFHDLCVRKRSCLPWSSDVFWKFFTCKVHRKSSARIFTIHVSKYEALSCKVQTHFGSFHLAMYIKSVLGALSRFLCLKMKQFAVKFRRILEVFSVQAS